MQDITTIMRAKVVSLVMKQESPVQLCMRSLLEDGLGEGGSDSDGPLESSARVIRTTSDVIDEADRYLTALDAL